MGGVSKVKSVGGYEIKHRQEARYFDNELLERFSKCPGWLPLVFWLPIFGVVMWLSATRTAYGAGGIVGLVLAGIAFWTLAEYWLHRKFFHWRRFARFHFFLHGAHHEYPDDHGRLVFPPTASLGLAVPIFGLCVLVMGFETGLPFFGGFIVGYLWYDMTHYWTHVAKPKTRWGKFLRRHHMMHHFSEPHRKFGVTTPFWDLVFGTYGSPARRPARTEA